MKLCQTCGQPLAEEIRACPACGAEVGAGRQYVDDYRILEVLHEGHASMLCRAVRDGYDTPVMIRIFTPQAGVDDEVAERLKRELEEIRKLPAEGFVRHLEIKRSFDGLWYRVSEWVDTESWGDLFRGGAFSDGVTALEFFIKVTRILETLHAAKHFIPHLILNDIMVVRDEQGDLAPKIDYKLSRFFDPHLDRPGPMLRHLLEQHPDITNRRPLDYRSDIWSLGKIFVEILTADQEIRDPLSAVDDLALPTDAAVLLKTMLADDPDLRPRTMRAVAEALSRIAPGEIEAAKRRQVERVSMSVKAIRRLKRRQTALAASVVLLLIVASVAWLQFDRERKKSTSLLESYANRYAPSVAFVVAEYGLHEGEQVLYRNRTEGTAFLVDRRGYLLTNRHVACPWLEDDTLKATIAHLRRSGRPVRFDYRIYLWFEGAPAFKLSAGLMESNEIADVYVLETAYRSDGEPRLQIAGVARPPVETRLLVTTPLRDDFAVLKIGRVPEGLEPLPLDAELDPRRIPRLSRIINLGFPLGSRTQEAAVRVSVSRGHVRRTFENLIQVDAAFYGGDSGGPIIDMRGEVIGIASGVATRRAPGVIPLVTPLWNLAMVLPINKAVDFLQDIRRGALKWDGVLDLSVGEKLAGITELASQGSWNSAREQADREIADSNDPALRMAAAMMHFCTGDVAGAERLLAQTLSISPQNTLARFMLVLAAWMEGREPTDPHRAALLALDWRSQEDFFGYLVRLLEGRPDAAPAWENATEKAWVQYVSALREIQAARWEEAEERLRSAAMAASPGNWEFFLVRAKLEEIEQARQEHLGDTDTMRAHEAAREKFARALQAELTRKRELEPALLLASAPLRDPSAGAPARREAVEKLLELDPLNGEAQVALAFLRAMEEDWSGALTASRDFLRRAGRESGGRLQMGLLEPQLLHREGKTEEARARLEEFVRRTADPWYRAIAECLLGQVSPASIDEKAGVNPQNLLTLRSALGLWAEASRDSPEAVRHYKKALESLLDDWLEFNFARERIRRLRLPAG